MMKMEDEENLPANPCRSSALHTPPATVDSSLPFGSILRYDRHP